MKTFYLLYLTLWMAISIVHVSTDNSSPYERMIQSDDIKFQLFEYQNQSLLGNKPIVDSEALKFDDHLEAVWTAVDSLSSILSTILKAGVKGKTKKIKTTNSTRTTAKAIAYEILNSREINNEFRLQALLKSLESTIENASIPENKIAVAEIILAKLVDTFLYGESPFYRYPALAVPTLFTLASLVESFVETLIAKNHPLAKTTLVPCELAETIFKYFKPTLIDRFNEIEINADYERFLKYNKYVYSEKMINQPYVLDRIEGIVRCIRGDGGKEKYESEKLRFKGSKYVKPAAAVFRGLGLYVQETNTENVFYSLIKDNLGDENEFYYAIDVAYEPCARDYFSLVRQRLESEFEQARNKVLRLCQVEFRERERRPTGFGWLSIKVGSILAEYLEDGTLCKANKMAGLFNNFCDPYVKFTAKYELNGRHLKVEHQTEVKGHAASWTPIEETFHLDKIPKNATIDIEILNIDDQRIFGETTTIPLLVNRILLENSNSKLFITSTWRDEVDGKLSDKKLHDM